MRARPDDQFRAVHQPPVADAHQILRVRAVRNVVTFDGPLERRLPPACPEDNVRAVGDLPFAYTHAVVRVCSILDVVPLHSPLVFVSVPASPHVDLLAVHCLPRWHASAIACVQPGTQVRAIDHPLELVSLCQHALLVRHGQPFGLGRLAHPENDVGAVACSTLAHTHAIVIHLLVPDVLPRDLPPELRGVPARPQDDVGAILHLSLAHAEAILRVCLVLDLISNQVELELLRLGVALPQNHVGPVPGTASADAEAPPGVAREPHKGRLDEPAEGVAGA
mmetsp:Transcript_15680/g.39861  ORF Transcript_15680/g.39861 Transcript_15680/m.39861 type:complete len:279 (+) Transcript_15680:544-1380(+)